MIIKNVQNYDGSDLHQRFAYRYLRKNVGPLGDVVIFRGNMNVKENLVDQEDLLNNDYINSYDAINIIWEIPNLCPLGAVAFQRLFNVQIANILSTQYLNKPIEVDGDDLMVHQPFTGSDNKEYNVGKCSVSITYSKNNVALGHTGINIVAGRSAPGFAFSTNLSDEDVESFMVDIQEIFYTNLQDMYVATTKVIV